MSVTVIPDTGVNNIVVFPNGAPSLNLNAPSNSDKVEVEVKEFLSIHNYLEGLQGGETGKFFHLSEEQYLNLVTGDIVRPEDTGLFYPANNPSGFITGSNLQDLGDVILSNPQNNQTLIYNSGIGVWENQLVPAPDLSNYLPLTGGTITGALTILDTTLAGSGSLASSVLGLNQTWNTTGTPTAIKLNVTDTSSNAGSLLMDLQVGGSSKFKVDKGGKIYPTSVVALGDIEVETIGNAIIIASPNGTRWRITINNSGALITTPL